MRRSASWACTTTAARTSRTPVDITEGPPEPNIFKDLDGDEDGKLSKEEVLAFFKKQGRDELPEGLWEKEDKNEDGVISWEEFSGPKGKTAPPLKDEV